MIDVNLEVLVVAAETVAAGVTDSGDRGPSAARLHDSVLRPLRQLMHDRGTPAAAPLRLRARSEITPA